MILNYLIFILATRTSQQLLRPLHKQPYYLLFCFVLTIFIPPIPPR